MAALCAWAGAFAHWCRYSGQAALPLLPTLLLAGSLLATVSRSADGKGAGANSWALLTAGSAAIPPLALAVEFLLVNAAGGTPPLFTFLFAATTALLARWGWRRARAGDWASLGAASALLLLVGNLSWLVLLATVPWDAQIGAQ